MTDKLKQLVSQYILLQEKIQQAETELVALKTQIIDQTKKEKVKKVKTQTHELYLVSQSETRFPQQNDPKRKQVEKIVKKSGELDKVMGFDIIKLGNAYDEAKLSAKLMKALEPFAQKVRLTKIRLLKLTP